VTAAAANEPNVAQLSIRGSARHPELMDQWSDIDVGLRLSGPVALSSLLPPGSTVWALDRQGDDARSSCRVVLDDAQRLDLVITPTGPAGILVADDPPDATVNQARFVAAQAIVKYGRGDLLIGSHLTLELAQLCLIEAMLLRDRDEGTTSHRFGTGRDELAADIWTAVNVDDDSGTRRIRRLAGEFDRLHSELDGRYVPDWSGLQSLIGQ